ncbi:SRPBCC family protein [Streptomyces sp. Root1310]|uniref:SRPBCC family protein n=1 Tax=Streptomyces sp. Root1310 TaxID=1736452 RepID=UPI00070E6345|nr:SRPBCC family protein [Streptomyces sp. Root1310]KQX77172.1 polyketide cyclase [Streptomyces sp. Root1310]
MVEVERVMTVRHPLDEVVRYLADFSHTEMWDPGTVTCERLGGGAVSVGAEWRNVSEFRGRRTELRYRLVRWDPERLTFVGRNKTATSTDDMRFEEHAGVTRLTYRARIDFHGLARLAGPLLKREFERLGDQVSERLPRAVDRALGAPRPQGDRPG